MIVIILLIYFWALFLLISRYNLLILDANPQDSRYTQQDCRRVHISTDSHAPNFCSGDQKWAKVW